MGKIYAIGDIHGCHDKLLVAVAKIKAHAAGEPYRAIFLGDYIDRGPKSREVVNLVLGLCCRGGKGEWQALKGNHEDMMIAWAEKTDGGMDMWRVNGGVETLQSYQDQESDWNRHLRWFKSLPTKIETENHVFVHAGCSPRYSLNDQPEEVLLWIRGWERDNHDFGKHVVYGHTPKKKPVLLGHSTGLDTGAVFGGPLSVGVFDSERSDGPSEILEAA